MSHLPLAHSAPPTVFEVRGLSEPVPNPHRAELLQKSQELALHKKRLEETELAIRNESPIQTTRYHAPISLSTPYTPEVVAHIFNDYPNELQDVSLSDFGVIAEQDSWPNYLARSVLLPEIMRMLQERRDMLIAGVNEIGDGIPPNIMRAWDLQDWSLASILARDEQSSAYEQEIHAARQIMQLFEDTLVRLFGQNSIEERMMRQELAIRAWTSVFGQNATWEGMWRAEFPDWGPIQDQMGDEVMHLISRITEGPFDTGNVVQWELDSMPPSLRILRAAVAYANGTLLSQPLSEWQRAFFAAYPSRQVAFEYMNEHYEEEAGEAGVRGRRAALRNMLLGIGKALDAMEFRPFETSFVTNNILLTDEEAEAGPAALVAKVAGGSLAGFFADRARRASDTETRQLFQEAIGVVQGLENTPHDILRDNLPALYAYTIRARGPADPDAINTRARQVRQAFLAEWLLQLGDRKGIPRTDTAAAIPRENAILSDEVVDNMFVKYLRTSLEIMQTPADAPRSLGPVVHERDRARDFFASWKDWRAAFNLFYRGISPQEDRERSIRLIQRELRLVNHAIGETGDTVPHDQTVFWSPEKPTALRVFVHETDPHPQAVAAPFRYRWMYSDQNGGEERVLFTEDNARTFSTLELRRPSSGRYWCEVTDANGVTRVSTHSAQVSVLFHCVRSGKKFFESNNKFGDCVWKVRANAEQAQVLRDAAEAAYLRDHPFGAYANEHFGYTGLIERWNRNIREVSEFARSDPQLLRDLIETQASASMDSEFPVISSMMADALTRATSSSTPPAQRPGAFRRAMIEMALETFPSFPLPLSLEDPSKMPHEQLDIRKKWIEWVRERFVHKKPHEVNPISFEFGLDTMEKIAKKLFSTHVTQSLQNGYLNVNMPLYLVLSIINFPPLKAILYQGASNDPRTQQELRFIDKLGQSLTEYAQIVNRREGTQGNALYNGVMRASGGCAKKSDVRNMRRNMLNIEVCAMSVPSILARSHDWDTSHLAFVDTSTIENAIQNGRLIDSYLQNGLTWRDKFSATQPLPQKYNALLGVRGSDRPDTGFPFEELHHYIQVQRRKWIEERLRSWLRRRRRPFLTFAGPRPTSVVDVTEQFMASVTIDKKELRDEDKTATYVTMQQLVDVYNELAQSGIVFPDNVTMQQAFRVAEEQKYTSLDTTAFRAVY